jgi:hypothetical protein
LRLWSAACLSRWALRRRDAWRSGSEYPTNYKFFIKNKQQRRKKDIKIKNKKLKEPWYFVGPSRFIQLDALW